MIAETERVTFRSGPWACTEFVVAHISPVLRGGAEAYFAARPMDVYGRFAEAPRRASVADLVAVPPRPVDQYLCNLSDDRPLIPASWIVGCAVCGRIKIGYKRKAGVPEQKLLSASGAGHLTATPDHRQAKLTAFNHALSHGPPGIVHEVSYAAFKAAVEGEATAATVTLEPGVSP